MTQQWGKWLGAVGIGLALWVAVSLTGVNHPLYAQEQVGSYTVQSGDTLAVIAERFGITVELLSTVNGIADPNLIQVGQVLLIPGGDATLAAVPTVKVTAEPGETLAMLAGRYNQDPQVLTTLNALTVTTRLFPGQPIALPVAAAPPPTRHLGAITAVQLPATVVQGRTGQVIVQSSRPLSLTATWNGLPLVFTPRGVDRQSQFTLLPAPALIAPAPYTFTLTYTARNGVPLTTQQQITVIAGPYESQVLALPDDKGSLLAPELVDNELALVSNVWDQRTPTLWWSTVFTRPIGTQYATTSPFGTRRSYDGGPINSYHAGQDFGAPEGVPILAPAPGTVALAAGLKVRGNAVLLDHGRGIYTGYWHMSEIYVTTGQPVQTGDVLGLVGTTGLSTGAHLHWEMRIYGVAVDPMQFLSEPIMPP